MGTQNLTGHTLGQYELRELLGAGGMGAVYRGYQANLKRYVAVKVISAELAQQPGYMERFTREAETSAALQHPHIIKIFDYGMQGGISYIVLEMLNGGTLAERIEQSADTDHPLPSLGEIADLLSQVCSALDYAHSQGVVHRDIKPSNVMFDDHGNAYLVDFGIAKLAQATQALTESGMMIGTWGYMAPEQWRSGDILPTTDQYALGIMTYALVTGQMPFDADTPANIMHKHLNETPIPPQTYRPDAPEAMTLVIGRALAKKPKNRFPTCTAFAQAFDGAIRGNTGPKTAFFTAPVQRKPPTPAPIPMPPDMPLGPPTGARPITRHPAMWLALAVIVVMAVVIALLVSGGGGEDEATPSGAESTATVPATATTEAAVVAAPSETRIPADTPAPTHTALPTDTATVPPSDTPLPTATPTVDVMQAAQATLDANLTQTATQWTPTPTEDFQATIDAQVTALFAQGQTETAAAWTDTPTLTPSNTPTPTLTPMPTATATATLTPTPTSTVTPTHTPSPTATFTPKPEPLQPITAANADQVVELARLGRGAIADIAWSPDGQTMAMASSTGIWLYDVGNLEAEARLLQGGSEYYVTSVAWSPDGTRLVVGGSDYAVHVWDVASETEQMTLVGHTSGVSVVAWSPDGARLASGGSDGVRVWDAATGTLLRVFEGHADSVISLAWSPDGVLIASGSTFDDPTVRVWNATNGNELLVLSGHERNVASVAWSPDGTRLASAGGDNTVRIWDTANGNELAVLTSHRDWVTDVAWSPDGTRLVSSSWDKTMRVWDAASGAEQMTLSGHTYYVTDVAWSPDGTRLVSSSWDGTLRVWDAASGNELISLSGYISWVYSVAWSPDGTRLAAGETDGTVRVWDTASGTDPIIIEANSYGEVEGLAWSPDGTRLASGGIGSQVRVWDATNGNELAALSDSTEGMVYSVAWSPDGTRLAFTGYGTVHVWDVASWTKLATFEGHTNWVTSIAWSPDGSRIVSGSHDNLIQVWDVASGTSLLTFEGPTQWVESVAWSPDGTRIASSGGGGNEVSVWDATNGDALLTLEGHWWWVERVAWSPDGTLLASASIDNTVRLWDAASGAAVATLEGHTSGLWDLAWSSDGGRIASGSRDGTVRVWGILNETAVIPAQASTDTASPPVDAAALDAFFPAGSSNAEWMPVAQDFGGVEMVLVPAGCFLMGSSDAEIATLIEQLDWDWFVNEGPQHKVCLPAFWIGQTEVTNAQYKTCVDAGACTPPQDRTYFDDPAYVDHPVVNVNWQQAHDYALWFGGSLPTEAQWEYAARGPESWTYPWGNEFDGTRLNYCDVNCEYDWFDQNYNDGYAHTAPVGTYPSGVSWAGALDMSGNAWEWVADWYDEEYYATLPDGVLYPTGPVSGEHHVVRGDSWYDHPLYARSAFRAWYDATYRPDIVGFRVVVGTDTAITPDPLEAASNFSGGNADWTPVVQEFDGVAMVLVPAGCFMMGSENGYDDERPVHEVCFEEPFWIDRTEVPRASYAECVSAGACEEIPPSDYSTQNDQPIIYVTWYQASDYCAWRDTRLPTEAEWAYAARGPDALVYPWGNFFECSRGNFDDETILDSSVVEGGAGCDGFDYTAPVGSFEAGQSWVGALDMSGNVWEWVADWYGDAYSSGQQVNPQGPDSGDYRVWRGNSFDAGAFGLRAAVRHALSPEFGNFDVGFRCAHDF